MKGIFIERRHGSCQGPPSFLAHLLLRSCYNTVEPSRR